MDDIFPHDGSFSRPGGPSAAIVLCRAPHGNLHAGLLFRASGVAKALHLGWQDHLLDSLKLGGLWAVPKVEPEFLFATARMCQQIWRRFELERKLPYALQYSGTAFDAEGRLLLGPGARGLTCATFVLAVLQSVGISLVDESSWPIRTPEDREFLAAVRRHASPSHFAVLEQEVERGVRRIRPDEVTAACLVDPPACFDETRERAAAVVKLLDEREPSV